MLQEMRAIPNYEEIQKHDLAARFQKQIDIDFAEVRYRHRLPALKTVGLLRTWYRRPVGIIGGASCVIWKEMQLLPLADSCSILPPISLRKLRRCKHRPIMKIM